MGNPARGNAESAFSLLEVLIVIGLMTLLLGMTVPAVNSLANSGGRAGALNVVMNTFEQARAAALQASANVYIVFADANHPDENKRYRAFIVMRDSVTALDGPNTTNKRFVALSRWQFLPRGISFRNIGASMLNAANMTPLGLEDSREPFLANSPGLPASLPYVQFTSTGIVRQPADSAHLQLFIYEGYWDSEASRDTATARGGDLLDQISLARFTGRAQVDVRSETTL